MPMIEDIKCIFNVGPEKWTIFVKETSMALNVFSVEKGVPIYIVLNFEAHPIYTKISEDHGIFQFDDFKVKVNAYTSTQHGRIEIITTSIHTSYEIPYIVAKGLQTIGSGSTNVVDASLITCKKSCTCKKTMKEVSNVMTIANLIIALKDLEHGSFKKKNVLNNYSHKCACCCILINKKINAISTMCCELLTDEGGCKWDNIEILRKNGYAVYAGEQDRFGWLTACIDTTKGTIIYG